MTDLRSARAAALGSTSRSTRGVFAVPADVSQRKTHQEE